MGKILQIKAPKWRYKKQDRYSDWAYKALEIAYRNILFERGCLNAEFKEQENSNTAILSNK